MSDSAALLAEGRQHHLAGRLGQAEAAYRAVLAEDAENGEALHMLGLVACSTGDARAGLDLLSRAVKKRPWLAGPYSDLGLAYQAVGERDKAILCFRQALKLQPGLVAAHNNLGMALKSDGKPDAAAESYRKALSLAPDTPELHNNLGTLLDEQGKLGAAIACYERAVALRPDNAETRHNLGNSLLRQGRVADSVACFRDAIRLQPDLTAAGTNLLMALQYDPAADAATLLEAATGWATRHGGARKRANFTIDASTTRKLRVGYVCGDFREHPTAYFIESLLAAQAGSGIEALCYANQQSEDAMSARLRRHAAGWRRIDGLDARRAAAQIAEDRIDILVDLSGHTKDNRLDIFALGAAPLQIAWYAYPGTTGLATMDYVIADRTVLPEADEKFLIERPLRLPDCHMCFTPPSENATPGPLPLAESDYVTFGSFNNPAKISPEVVALWSEVLQAVPRSRLRLSFRWLADPDTAARFRAQFESHGIAPDRLELGAAPSRAAALVAYRAIDVALDTFPYNGTTTSCEALWMGVPVIALAGTRFAARVGESFLGTVGLADCVADSKARYVEIAAGLAADPARLARLRAELRPRLLASPLCDAKRFAANLEAALRDAWRTRWGR